MVSPSPSQPSELAELQAAATRALRETLSDASLRAAVESAADGDADLTRQLGELYADFEAMVIDTSASVIAKWADDHGLEKKMAAVTNAANLAEYAIENVEAEHVSEKEVQAKVLAEKKVQLARMMEEIEKEEKATALIRVETARQKDVLAELDRKMRARVGEIVGAIGEE